MKTTTNPTTPYIAGGRKGYAGTGPTGAPGRHLLGPHSGRGPNGKLRNFQAMKLGKLTSVGRQVFREDNDPAAMSMIATVIQKQGYSLVALIPEAVAAKLYGGPVEVESDDLGDILEDLGI